MADKPRSLRDNEPRRSAKAACLTRTHRKRRLEEVFMANRLVLPVIMITNLRLVSPAFSQGFKLLTMVPHPFGV